MILKSNNIWITEYYFIQDIEKEDRFFVVE